jgi:hypothetical protein
VPRQDSGETDRKTDVRCLHSGAVCHNRESRMQSPDPRHGCLKGAEIQGDVSVAEIAIHNTRRIFVIELILG